MVIFLFSLFIFGSLLFVGGFIAFFQFLPFPPRNLPLKEAFSELFDDDRVTISVMCMVLGAIIILFLMYCFGSAF